MIRLAASVALMMLFFAPTGLVGAQPAPARSAEMQKDSQTTSQSTSSAPVDPLTSLAITHGLSLAQDEAAVAHLRDVLGRFPDIVGAPERIGPVLVRPGTSSTLWLFEFQRREFALRTSPGRYLEADIAMLAILIEYHAPGLNLPAWQQGFGDPPQPPHTATSLARLAAIDDLRMGMAQRFVLFASEPQGGALEQSVAQSVSPEFHPGLLNSALSIDVQRAIDVVAAMVTGQPPPDRFHKVPGIEVRLPAPAPLDLQPAPDNARRQVQTEREALHRQMALDREARAHQQADERAQREARQAQDRAEREARQTAARAERDAERARRQAATRAQIDAMNERARQRIEALRDAASVPPGSTVPPASVTR